jgi:Tfp pilus assembly protein PilO
VGAIAWTLGGWPACAALVATMLVVMAAIVIFGWSGTARQEKPSPIEPP